MRGKERSDLVRFRAIQLEEDGEWGDFRRVRVLFWLLDEWWMETVVGFEWES